MLINPIRQRVLSWREQEIMYMPLGLGYIATVLRNNGHTVNIIERRFFYKADYWNDKIMKEVNRSTKKVIEDFSPDLIGITASTPLIMDALRTVKLIKDVNPNIITLIGGCHPTAYPEFTLKQCPQLDIVCRGEGEITTLEIANGMPWDKIDGITYRKEGRIVSNPKRKYLENLEAKSLQFIKDIYIKNKNHSFAVSFSGGKDSVVTLYLAKKVINNFDTIWMNTTIDFPETEKYVHEICKNWDLKLIELKPTKDFFTLWDELGPPSKFMRWCCQTVKFAPLNQYIDSHYEDEVITASGVRKNESNSRSKYDSVQVNKIIPKQILFFPILEWNSLEVWLYMIWKVIPINDVYLKGFSRIGCWLCPEKTLREFKKMEIVYPQLINQLNNKLYEYTENKKIHDVDKWVKDGKWRYRVSRYVKEKIDKRSTCSVKPQYIYNLKNDKKDEVNQFLKIFGPIKQRGKITTIQNHNFDLSIINNTIRVSYYSDSKKIQKIFEKQLERAVNCINCGACIGNCPMNAIKIENNRYTISPTCNYCLNCIKSNGIRKMCIALNYKTNIATIH